MRCFHVFKPCLIVWMLLSLAAQPVFSQWIIGGTTAALANDCYRLTTNANALSGYAYNPQSINLNDSFDVSFIVNVGSSDIGADGIMFILRQSLDPQQLIAGSSGGNIGYTGTGLENGSIGIEIDTYQNIDFGDPAADHIAIFKNASTNHNAANLLASAVQASSTSVNIEDGLDHVLRVKWNPTSSTLQVYFDCELRLSYIGNIINTVFGGNATVYYGLIGTTGGVSNAQSFCLTQPIDSLMTPLKNDTICAGESLQLNAGNTLPSYQWWPSSGLSSSNIHNPIATPTATTTYSVTASYNCQSRIDSATVAIFETDKASFDLGNDTTLCQPDSLVIDLTNTSYAGYLWSDGSSEKVNVVYQSTALAITITHANGCSFSDTIEVEINSGPNFSLGADKTLCYDDSVKLNLPFPVAESFWSNGATSPEIFVKTPGLYWVRVSHDFVCYNTDTILVSLVEQPLLNLGNDTAICENTNLLKSAASSNADSYSWSDNSSEAFVSLMDSGLYWVEISVNGCTFRDSILVSIIPNPTFELGNDTSICKGDMITISPKMTQLQALVWSDSSTDSSFLVQGAGVYAATALFDNGCQATDALEVSEMSCPNLLEIPNIFTPNGDHINDFLEPRFFTNIVSGELQIFNRWGQKLYLSDLSDAAWDGTQNGHDCPNGIYFWTAKYFDFEGTEHFDSGSFTLTR